MQCPYIGLTNQSSTCYMNSYLQYLYMHKEFRAMLFSLDLKPENKEDEKDCIPYQLQKLFSKLNLKKNKQISTKDLCASFQWTVEDVFAEHDVSEFAKLLMQAFKDSLDAKNLEYFNWLTSLNEGLLSQYVICEECSFKSTRQEKFSEINLIIRNEWENLYFKKLENSLMETIKPIKLSGDNAYFCENCQSKQNAEKGMEYSEFPKVMVFNLNRFVFDMETLQRKKLDEYFEFPLVLDMNKFKGTYNEVSGLHKNLAEYDVPIEKLSKGSKFNNLGSDKILLTEKGKKFKNTKSSSHTQNFLKNMRKNMKKAEKQELEVLVDGTLAKELEESHSLNIDRENVMDHVKPLENSVEEKNCKFEALNTQLKTLNNNINSSSLFNMRSDNNIGKVDVQENLSSDHHKYDACQLEVPNNCFKGENSADLHLTHQDDGIDDNKEVYYLQAVFIHKGSAFSGHYYIYIKSFDNNMWYLFDDYQVQEVNIADILKDGFGGHRLQISAYMLIYRSNKAICDTLDDKIKGMLVNISCPFYMQGIIEQEMKLEEDILKKKALLTKNKKIKHKIFFKLQTASVEVEGSQLFSYFETRCFEAFKIPEEEQSNCRLRLYNKFKDEMMNTFENKKNSSMDILKLNVSKNFIIEVKEEGQSFEDYKTDCLSLKLLFWTPQADDIDFVPDYKKLDISKNSTVKGLIDKIRVQFSDTIPKTEEAHINIVFKHTYKNGSLKGENLSLLSEKKIVELFITNNTILHVDVSKNMIDAKTPYSFWVDFFEKENNKIVVNFNYPAKEENASADINYCYKLKIDMNLTMRDLKDKVIEILNINAADDFIIKKGGKSGVEIKDFTKVIRTLRIINNSFIFLVFGQSTSVNEIKVNLFLATSELQTNFHSLNRDLIFLKELAINPYLTPAKLIENLTDRLPNIYQSIKDQNQKCEGSGSKPLLGVPFDVDLLPLIENSTPNSTTVANKLFLNPENTRLREKTGNILTKYYHNYSLKNQGAVERKKVVIELFKRKLDSNEILVYYSKLDCQNLTLSPAKEVIVNKKFNLLEFSSAIICQGLDIDLGSLEATKIRDVREFIIEDILDHCFFDMSKTDMLLSSAPFYLETDGCMFM